MHTAAKSSQLLLNICLFKLDNKLEGNPKITEKYELLEKGSSAPPLKPVATHPLSKMILAGFPASSDWSFRDDEQIYVMDNGTSITEIFNKLL
ncbi:hypothetical protein CHS0354_020074 [Potamilus streckersoni]|uniref:Uncharacterized protein n=1 Tax=Potamilus streckersoni TaxID=2493646 RepID=A0AAE0VSP5_9BIVA|nr:hypothetical protein CHS0354_020074 [Potamilus streckersoni]